VILCTYTNAKHEDTTMIMRHYNKEKFMSANPTLIGVVNGIRFYEHPTCGDEVPLVAVSDDFCGLTDFWDLPEFEDLVDFNMGMTS